jgi:hypothetical protein
MSRHVVPRYRGRAELDTAPAKLVSTLLSVAAAGLVDGGRFRRGRQYMLDGSVTALTVDQGELIGEVQGSRSDAYRVRIGTRLVPAPVLTGVALSDRQALAAIAPDTDELDADCTCPDGGSPCKHVAAVLLAFAAEAGDDPGLMLAWRCGDVAPRSRAAIGSRLRRDSPRTAPVPSPFATPEWRVYFGSPEALSPHHLDLEPLRIGYERLGPFDVSEAVRSAHAAMRSAGRLFS